MALSKLGIKETKEGLGLVYAIVNATGGTLADGKVTLSDLPRWFPVSTKVGAAVDNFKAIWPELKDLDKAESDELLRWSQTELDIPQDQVEKWLELAVGILLRLVELYSMQLVARQAKARVAAVGVTAVSQQIAPIVVKAVEPSIVEPEPEPIKEKAGLFKKNSKKTSKKKTS